MGSHGFQGKLRGDQLSSTEYKAGFYKKLTPRKQPLRGGGGGGGKMIRILQSLWGGSGSFYCDLTKSSTPPPKDGDLSLSK